ncbi:hypothetical protein HOM50_03555 [bacterium]|nr:hypothetical protein [bacterium]MBT5015454.1 hypothetical protein [bacterium]
MKLSYKILISLLMCLLVFNSESFGTTQKVLDKKTAIRAPRVPIGGGRPPAISQEIIAGVDWILDPTGNSTQIGSGGDGDVEGPAFSTNNAIAIFNGSDGKRIKNSGVTIDSNTTLNGATQINVGDVSINQTVIKIGASTDTNQNLLQVRTNATNPTLSYKKEYYSDKGILYINPNAGEGTILGVQSQDEESKLVAVTGDRTKTAILAVYSDENVGAGSTDDLRGWTLTKSATNGDLQFNFFNSDTGDGKPLVNTFSLVSHSGFDKTVTLEADTVLMFNSDTNLYRSASNTLKTDDAFQAGGLVTAENGLTVSTGSVTVTPFSTAGVIHNDASGLLSSSLIVNNDVATNAGIVDTKLATISTAGKVANSATTATPNDTANAIIARDSSGDFSAGIMTGSASLNVLKAGDTMTGNLNMAATNEVRFQDTTGGQYVGVHAPGAVSTSYTLTLPTAVGSTGQILAASNGTGTLEWTTNTGASAVTTMAAVGSTPNANAGSISSNTLTLQPASASFPGVVTTGTQTFAGTKTFSAIGGTALTIDGSSSVDISRSTGNTSIGRNADGTVLLDGATLDIDADVINVEALTASQAVVTDGSKNLTSLEYTAANTPSTIVARDGSGDFNVNMITVGGTVTNDTDVATKAYVDSVASGLDIKDPSRVRGASNVTLVNTQTIDGVVLVADDRVLLTNQTDATENGIWLVKAGTSPAGDWVRPTDFPNGGSAAGAYTFIEEGTLYANSSYVCTNTAGSDVIDTNNLEFAQFSASENIVGANVGSGDGDVFRDKTGSTLNFKTIAAGTHMVVTNNANDISLSTDAASANTSSTIVARDGSGDFSTGTITATALAGTTLGINGSTIVNINTTAGNTTIGRDAAGTILLDGATLDIDADVINVEALTASQAVVTDGSKNLTSLEYTDSNTASTLVQRDGSGDFSAGTITADLTGSVTGAASLNVLKAGDTMTGNLNMDATINMNTQNEIRFQDDSGGEYVGIKAPTGVTSYTLNLPATTGSLGQAIVTDGSNNLSFASRVAGPGTSTDNAIARYNGTSGSSLEDSSVLISDSDAASGITQLDVDNVRIDGNSITSTDPNGDINITPDGSGEVVLDGLNWPTADGASGQVISTNGSGQLAFSNAAGSGFVSTFGDQIVTNRVNQIALLFQYNVPTDLVTVSTLNTGTVEQTQGLLKLNTGLNAAGFAQVTSKDVLHYTPGHESAVFFTAAWTTGVADSYQYIGLYDDNDGWAIGYNETNFGVLFRRDGGTDVFINQASFNLDPLNGSGPSGFTIDQTKINVFRIAYGWLGSAPITFYVVTPQGEWIAFHRIEQPNASNEPSVINPTLPMRAETVNTDNTSDLELRTVCWNGTSQGQLVGMRNYTEFTLNKSISSTEIPIMTIRNKTTFAAQINKTTIRSIYANFGVENTDLIAFNFVKNATLTGAAYTDVDASFSVAEVDRSATAVSGGTQVYTTMTTRDAGNSNIFFTANDLDIFLRPGETLTITARNLAAGSSENNVVFGWDEIQ